MTVPLIREHFRTPMRLRHDHVLMCTIRPRSMKGRAIRPLRISPCFVPRVTASRISDWRIVGTGREKDVAFRDRAPRIERIDGGDYVVVETDQILSGIGLISNAGARFAAPRRSPPRGASKTCSAGGTTPSNT